MCFLVVAISDLRGSYKHFKRVIFFNVELSLLNLLLQLLHSLLPMAGKAEFLLETPQDGGPCFDARFAKHVVKDHHLVPEKYLHDASAISLSILNVDAYFKNYSIARRQPFSQIPRQFKSLDDLKRIHLKISSRTYLALSPTMTNIVLWPRLTPFSMRVFRRGSSFFLGILTKFLSNSLTKEMCATCVCFDF